MAANPLAKLLKSEPDESKTKLPGSVEDRMKRGRQRMGEDRSRRNECLSFWRGDQYVYRAPDNYLVNQSTITNPDGSGKPRHRVRTTRNMIVKHVRKIVSAATSRVPNYEVNPSTSDDADTSAATLAGKVLRYGYDKWNIRGITSQVVTYSVVADEGFAWPYWDSTVGPYMKDEKGNVVGQGEVCISVYSPNECYWEPGLKFDESRWHVIEQAREVQSVYEMDGYLGGTLKPDAQTESSRTSGRDNQNAKLVLVSEYLERPSPSFPNGRWLTIANKKVIAEPKSYPCIDEKGQVIDEPVIHHLTYITDPDSDRDQGLVRHLLDAQRTYNDCTNKQLEWKNLALNPQVIIQNGEFKQRLTDEPGAVYHAIGSGQITWRPVPPVPSELSEIKDEARRDMAAIAAQNDIPSQVSSAQGIAALLDSDQAESGDFYNNLAEFHSRLARHCLYLVQRYYTEDRLIRVRGERGWELIEDFRGAQLRGQMDVTVLPGSLEPRSRTQLETRIMTYAQLGWISGQEAMVAIENGTAEHLVQKIEKDIARANLIIEKLRAGPEVLFSMPPRQPFLGEDPGIDPMTGQPQRTIPGWMPRPFDSIPVQKAVFEDWMKTTDYDTLEPGIQEAANQYYDALLLLEAQQAARNAAMQTQMAQNLGMSNAARPQTGSPMPSIPGGTSQPGGGDMALNGSSDQGLTTGQGQ